MRQSTKLIAPILVFVITCTGLACGQQVTAVWSNGNHLDLFIADSTGVIKSTWWEPQKSWQPWFPIHPESAVAAPGQAVTALWSNPNHLDLFITDKSGVVKSTFWEFAKSWQPWFPIHPETATAARGQPVTALWSNRNHLDLFITDEKGVVKSTWWEPQKSWQPWFPIHPETATAAPAQPVTALWRNPNHLDLFITDKTGLLKSTFWEFAKNWQPWVSVPIPMGDAKPVMAAPGQAVTALWRNSTELDLFWNDKDSSGVVMTVWQLAGGWHAWRWLGPCPQIVSTPNPDIFACVGGLSGAAQPITAVWRNPNHLDLFLTDSTGAVQSIFWDPNKPPVFSSGGDIFDVSWGTWFPIHPETATAAPARPVTALWSNSNHLDLFIADKNGVVRSTWWEPQKSWQPWFPINR